MACNSSNTENLSSIVANMALAHEMIMNDDFQFKAISEVTENSLQKNVHDIVHRAFWDVLESEVTSNPPQYKNAFNLLMEMKTLVLEIIPEKGESIRKEVEDYLDRDLISQQIEHDTFDVYNCASCVLGTLSKLCAPVRDETVSQLKEETNLVSLLRGTFELINLIKMDIANYELKTVKPILIQQAVEYEKAKFMDYLRENINGLQRTKIWLKNTMNIIKLLQKPESATKMTPGMTITHAYLSLMTPTETYIIPETLLLDELRLLEMSHTFEKLAYVISILTYCLNSVSKHLSTDQNFVKHLKDIILILLGDIKWNEQTMESIFSQVTAETDKESEKRLIEVDPKIDRSVLNKQLKDLLEPKNHLKQLIKSRLRDYVLLSMTSQTLGPPTSSVLLPIQKELKDVTARFVRVITHNKKVHYENYVRVVKELLKEEEKQEKEASNSDDVNTDDSIHISDNSSVQEKKTDNNTES